MSEQSGTDRGDSGSASVPAACFSYRVCGLQLTSAIEFPELVPVALVAPDLSFTQVAARPKESDPYPWIHHWHRPNGSLWRSCAKIGDRYLLRFHNLADFWIGRSGCEIIGQPMASVAAELYRHMAIDQVIPFCLTFHSREAIHGSVVVARGGAIAFAGDSGSGKSTLAASFVAAGWHLLSDDCLAMEDGGDQIFASGTGGGLRLRDDVRRWLGVPSGGMVAGDRKRLVPIGPLRGDRVPLQAVFVLSPVAGSGPPAAVRLDTGDALTELLRHAFRIDISDRTLLARQFGFFTELARRVAVFRLVYGHDFTSLPAIQEVISSVRPDLAR